MRLAGEQPLGTGWLHCRLGAGRLPMGGRGGGAGEVLAPDADGHRAHRPQSGTAVYEAGRGADAQFLQQIGLLP